jgi:hypothetical protein
MICGVRTALGEFKVGFRSRFGRGFGMDFVLEKRNQLWNPNHGFRLHDTATFGRVSESQTSCLLRDRGSSFVWRKGLLTRPERLGWAER